MPGAGIGGVSMAYRKTSILLVDDDVRMLRMMQRILELENYRVLTASSGEAAFDILLDGETPDLVLLDIVMPVMDGYSLCRHIREFSPVPVIMVTAKGEEEEKVAGLDSGADDYITKPFSSKELVARVRAVLRRTMLTTPSREHEFYCHDLVVDFARQRVTLGEREVNLTATEYRLLSYLAHNAGSVVTPDQILEGVWGGGYIGGSHLLQVNVARLRRKLMDDTKKPKYILTRSGIGYVMMKRT